MIYAIYTNTADVVKLVDTPFSGDGRAIYVGSNPAIGSSIKCLLKPSI
jgi:hypothetical protein